jgi:hypothetical protein
MDATDILLDDDGDLLIVNDDFRIGLSDEQHIEDILISYPGEYKQSPLCGVNIRRAINGSIDGVVRRDVRLNLEADGYQVNNIVFTESELSIDAKRTLP